MESQSRRFTRRDALLLPIGTALIIAGCNPMPTEKPDEQVKTNFGTLFLAYSRKGEVIDKTSGSFRLEIAKNQLINYHLTDNYIPDEDHTSDITYRMLENLGLVILIGRRNTRYFSFSPQLYDPKGPQDNFYTKWYCPVESLDQATPHTLWSRWSDNRFTKGGWDASVKLNNS